MLQVFDLLFEVDRSRHALSYWNDFQRNIISLKIAQCGITFGVKCLPLIQSHYEIASGKSVI